MPKGLMGPGRSETEVDRSRFLGEAFPMVSTEAFDSRLKELREAHPGARHHVFAWRMDPGTARYSDDGEPAGTGGPPLLDLLSRQDLEQAAVIVTRYFGGTLLGRPGLLRAYRTAASEALSAAPQGVFTEVREISLVVPWTAYPRVEGYLRTRPDLSPTVAFEDQVSLTVILADEGAETFLAAIRDVSAGQTEVSASRTYRSLLPV